MRSESGWAMRSRSSCATQTGPRNRCVRCALCMGLARSKTSNSRHLVPMHTAHTQRPFGSGSVPIKLRRPHEPQGPRNRHVRSARDIAKELTPPQTRRTDATTTSRPQDLKILGIGAFGALLQQVLRGRRPPVSRTALAAMRRSKHKTANRVSI